MKKYLILNILLTFSFVTAFAQTFPSPTISSRTNLDWAVSSGGFPSRAKPDRASLPDDIGLFVGVNAPMYKGVESDVTVGITYGHFNSDGLGFRAGFQFTPSVAEVDNVFGIPVAFAYRTRPMNTSGRVERGVMAAGETFGYDVLMGSPRPLQNAFASFIASLFSQMEFYAGITPGYISGESTSVSIARTTMGTTFIDEKSWTGRNGRFALTLDAGACFNYRIWRFDLKLSPVFHYNLTRNYVLHTDTVTFENGHDVGSEKSSEKPLRWFFTLTGGLSFKF